VSKVDLRLQCGMPCSKLEVSIVQHGTLSGAGYLHQSLGGRLPPESAVILTQVTFGRSVKATLDYLAGTVGGAIYAGGVSLLIPHANDFSLAGILAIVVAPLAFLGAVMPSFSAAPFTGVLVILVPAFAHVGPIESAVDRVLEVVVGCITALAVSLLRGPCRRRALQDRDRAHRQRHPVRRPSKEPIRPNRQAPRPSFRPRLS
jgi:hypothetical protein